MTKDTLEKFFQRYESFFMQSLSGEIDGNEIAELYAPEFIAASPPLEYWQEKMILTSSKHYPKAMSNIVESERKGCVFEL